MDLYPMTIMYYLYKPEVLSWPMLEGKPSFKLEQLNFANNLWLDGKAHNAMVDVQVTLALAKKLMQAPEVWQYLIQYFDKDSDSQRISKLPFNFKTALSEHQECFIIDCDFGKTANYQCPVISLGPHTYYKNQTLWLRLDRPELSDTTLENIPANTWAVKKKYGEPGFLLPKLPRFLKNTSDEYQLIVEANKCWLQENPEILQAISHYHRHYTYPKIPNIDVDAALYQNGFLSPEDEKLCREFHQADLEKKSQLLPLFFNKNLQQQAIRVLARNYPEHLPENFKLGFQTYLQQLHIDNEETAIRDYRNKKHLTPNAAQAEIDTIKNDKTLNESELKILNELEDYLKNF
jgi:exodeoxyribonuclease-1